MKSNILADLNTNLDIYFTLRAIADYYEEQGNLTLAYGYQYIVKHKHFPSASYSSSLPSVILYQWFFNMKIPPSFIKSPNSLNILTFDASVGWSSYATLDAAFFEAAKMLGEAHGPK